MTAALADQNGTTGHRWFRAGRQRAPTIGAATVAELEISAVGDEQPDGTNVSLEFELWRLDFARTGRGREIHGHQPQIASSVPDVNGPLAFGLELACASVGSPMTGRQVPRSQE